MAAEHKKEKLSTKELSVSAVNEVKSDEEQQQSIHSHSECGGAPETETENGAETETVSQGDGIKEPDDAVNGDQNGMDSESVFMVKITMISME